MDDFRRFFDEDLRPKLEKLEERRQKIYRKLLISLAVIAAVAVLVFFIFPVFRQNPAFIFFLFAGALAFGMATWWLLTRDFIKSFKRQVIPEIARFCDPSLRYSQTRHVSEHEFQESEIFKHRIDRFKGEDHVQGKIVATAIEFSELHAEYKTSSTDSKGRSKTQWHTIFKGLFFIADFNKHFHGTTVVLPDTAERLFGFLGKKLQSLNFTRGQLIKLEDPDFEKLFVVYGDDQVEARYILSTALMRRITEFRNRTGHRIYLSFVRSRVNVAISMTRNLFEPRIFRSVLDYRLASEYLNDLQFATGIVEDLNLNTRIWTKE